FLAILEKQNVAKVVEIASHYALVVAFNSFRLQRLAEIFGIDESLHTLAQTIRRVRPLGGPFQAHQRKRCRLATDHVTERRDSDTSFVANGPMPANLRISLLNIGDGDARIALVCVRSYDEHWCVRRERFD